MKQQLHNILIKLGALVRFSPSKYAFVRPNGKRKYRFPDHSCDVVVYRNSGEKVPGYFDISRERFYIFRTYTKVHKGGNRHGNKGDTTITAFALPIKVCNMLGWELI